MDSIIQQYIDSFNQALDNHEQLPQRGMLLFGQQQYIINFLAKYLIFGEVSYKEQDDCEQQTNILMNNPLQIVTLCIKGLLINTNNNKIYNHQSGSIQSSESINQFNQLLFLQSGIKFFNLNSQRRTSILLVLNHSKFNLQYLKNNFQCLINIWGKNIFFENFQNQIQSQNQLEIQINKKLLSKLNLALYNYDFSKQSNFLNTFKQLGQSKDKQDMYFSKISEFFYSERNNRIFYFQPQQIVQQNASKILKKIFQNVSSQNYQKIPQISLVSREQKYKKQIQITFKQANQKYKNIIQIFKYLFNYLNQGNQQIKNKTIEKLNILNQNYNIEGKLSFQAATLLKNKNQKYQQNVKAVKEIKVLFTKQKSYASINKFLKYLVQLSQIIIDNDYSHIFFKNLEYILEIVQGIINCILKCVQNNLRKNQLKQLIIQCTDIIQYMKQKFPKVDQKQIMNKQTQMIKQKLKILLQNSPFNKEISHQIFILAKQIGNILKRKNIIKQAIQCFMIIRYYDQVMILIKRDSQFHPQITKTYLNKLFKRFIYQNQYFYAQKCIEFIILRTFDEKNYQKIQLMQRKLKLNKNSNLIHKNKDYYHFLVNIQEIIQKLQQMQTKDKS